MCTSTLLIFMFLNIFLFALFFNLFIPFLRLPSLLIALLDLCTSRGLESFFPRVGQALRFNPAIFVGKGARASLLHLHLLTACNFYFLLPRLIYRLWRNG